MKKVISAILSVIILITAVPLYAFADSSTLPASTLDTAGVHLMITAVHTGTGAALEFAVKGVTAGKYGVLNNISKMDMYYKKAYTSDGWKLFFTAAKNDVHTNQGYGNMSVFADNAEYFFYAHVTPVSGQSYDTAYESVVPVQKGSPVPPSTLSRTTTNSFLGLTRNVYQHNTAVQASNSASDAGTLNFFLQPDTNVQSTDPAIVALAAQITAGKTTAFDKALAIYAWVAGNIYYDLDDYKDDNYVLSRKSADVLARRRSTCSGYSYLTAALCRAAGIPAKVVKGTDTHTVWSKNGWGNVVGTEHKWNELFIDGQWITVDTTWGSGNRWSGGKVSDSKGLYRYAYFNPDMTFFSQTHYITDLPVAPASAITFEPSAPASFTGTETVTGLKVTQTGQTVTVSWNGIGSSLYRLCYIIDGKGWYVNDTDKVSAVSANLPKGTVLYFTVMPFSRGKAITWGAYCPVVQYVVR
jgi:hypothetical protein